MSDNPIGQLRGMAREMAKRSIVTEAVARLLEQVLTEASNYHTQRIDTLELALHRIVGHGNISGAKAREIAAEALGLQEPE